MATSPTKHSNFWDQSQGKDLTSLNIIRYRPSNQPPAWSSQTILLSTTSLVLVKFLQFRGWRRTGNYGGKSPGLDFFSLRSSHFDRGTPHGQTNTISLSSANFLKKATFRSELRLAEMALKSIYVDLLVFADSFKALVIQRGDKFALMDPEHPSNKWSEHR